MNPTQHMEAFARQAAAAAAPQPTKTYQCVVTSFYADHPDASAVPMETAYFLEKAGISPSDPQYFSAFHTYTHGKFVLDKRARADLKDVVAAVAHRSDASERPRLETLYNEAAAPFHGAGSSSDVFMDKSPAKKDELFDRDPYSPYKEPTTPSGMAPYTLP